MSFAADTSWLFSAFDRAQPGHGRARVDLEDPAPVFVNPIILAETLDLCRSKLGRQASQDILAALQSRPNVRLCAAPKGAVWSLAFAKQGAISWHDASAIATAIEEGAGLRTFDKDQRKAFEALA